MQVLITGAFGNVGSACLRELLRQGHPVRAFDLKTEQNERAAREFASLIEVIWGDIRDAATVEQAVRGVQAVIHLAAVIPPSSNEKPELAREVNVGGTRNVIRACQAQAQPPRLLFTSSLDVFGYTQSKPPPRRVTDPIVGTDPYSQHKVECEELVRASGLDWLILRLADVPILGLRDPHPIMFEIGLENRIEAIHSADVALAIVNTVNRPELKGRVLLIGGGKECQLTYRDYYGRMLTAMGIGMLPDEAFSKKEYVTDWLDTEESQRLLEYQRHNFDQIISDVAAKLGWRKPFVPLMRPFIRRSILNLSPYWKEYLSHHKN